MWNEHSNNILSSFISFSYKVNKASLLKTILNIFFVQTDGQADSSILQSFRYFSR